MEQNYVWMYFFLVSFCCTTAQSDCGHLAVEPSLATEGDTLRLIFTPSVPEYDGVRIWYKSAPNGAWEKLYDSRATDQQLRGWYSERKEGSKYVLVIPVVSVADAGQYNVMCPQDRFSNLLEVKVEKNVTAPEVVCGRLAISASTPPSGWRVTFYYLRTWERSSETWIREVNGQLQDILTPVNSKYSLALIDEWRSRIDISSAERLDSGHFRVVCAQGTVSSNVITLAVEDRGPSQPVISHVQTFPDCPLCLPVITGRRLTIECHTSGGSLPMQLKIKKNGELLQPVQTSLGTEPFSIVGRHSRTADVSDENAIYSCEVNNFATLTPLVTEVKSYLYKTPSFPVLTIHPVKAGSPATFSCVTSGGRPAPIVDFQFDKKWRHFQSDVIYDNESRTYTVSSIFRLTLHSGDNGKRISCGVTHATYTDRLCTHERPVNVTFPPSTVSLQPSEYTVIKSGFAEVLLTCLVSESNPRSEIVWTGLKNTKRKMKSSYVSKTTLGWTTTEALHVTADQSKHGREVRCHPHSESYTDVAINATYIFDVQYSPEVTISGHSEVVAFEGDSVQLKCVVNSNPISFVAWRNENDTLITKHISKGTLTLSMTTVKVSDAGLYMCVASNAMPPQGCVNISLVVKEKVALNQPISGEITSTLAVVICIAIVIAVAVVVVICVRKRKGRNQRKRDTKDEEEEAIEDKTQESPDEVAPQEIVEYAKVIPRSQRKPQNAPHVDADSTETTNATGPLIYAELDLPNSSNNETRILNESNPDSNQGPTEYVTIDFNRKPDSSPS